MSIDFFSSELIGWIGFICIMLCWFPQTIETIKQKKCTVNRTFLILSFIGAISLTVRSYFIQELPFILLNAVASIGSGINLYYSFKNSVESSPS